MSDIKEIKDFLIKGNYTLTTAESCTGGLVSSYLTDISGASNFIKQNFVTYSNEAKINLLGVSPNTINKYGVVSSNVAVEMVLGIIKKYKSDFAFSATGILGPTGGDNQNPIGTVYFGFASKSKSCFVKYQSNKKGRVAIKKDMAQKALSLLKNFLYESQKI